MRLYIENDSGNRIMMLLTKPTTVRDVKQFVEKAQGVPAAQQALLFAGRDLRDDSLVCEDLGLDLYNTRQEATLHMRRRLSTARSVWLTSSSTFSGRGQHLETVECGSSMAQMMELLAVRGLAAVPFAAAKEGAASSNVVVRRQDGSTTRLLVWPHVTILQLEEMIREAEGAAPESLAFLQAPDGCLHVVFGPSSGSAASSFPAYSRSPLPQAALPVKQAEAGAQEPLAALSRRLCVYP